MKLLLDKSKRKDVSTWSRDDVKEWALKQKDVEDSDADALFKNRVTGTSLLTLTEEKLTRHPYNIPGGPAASLAAAIQTLKKPIHRTALI